MRTVTGTFPDSSSVTIRWEYDNLAEIVEVKGDPPVRMSLIRKGSAGGTARYLEHAGAIVTDDHGPMEEVIR